MIRALGMVCPISRFGGLAPPSKRWTTRLRSGRIAVVLAALNVLSWLTVSPCQGASLQLQELQILGRDFLQPPLTGEPVVAVV
jgi:hypothetical protein